MAFRIDIIADPSQALRGAAAVEKGLNRAQIAGANLGGVIQKAFAAIGVGIGVRELITVGDSFLNLENRLRTVVRSEQDLFGVETRLFEISQKTRTGFSATVEIYQRFSAAVGRLGVTQTELFKVIENIGKAVALSGASAIESTNALRQFTQGLASGALRGDELRSVLEQLPIVADIIAEKLGVGREAIRELAAKGEVSTKVIIDAFLEADKLLARFDKTTVTVGQALFTLGNNFLKLVGDVEKSTGAISGFAQVIKFVGENLDTIFAAGLTIVLGRVGLLIKGMLASAAAAATYTASMAAATAATTAFGVSTRRAVAFQVELGLATAATGAKTAVETAAASGGLVALAKRLAASRLASLGLVGVLGGALVLGFRSFTAEVRRTREELEKLRVEEAPLSRIGKRILDIKREIASVDLTPGAESLRGRTGDIAVLEELRKNLAKAQEEARKLHGSLRPPTVELKDFLADLDEQNRLLTLSSRESEIQKNIEKTLSDFREKTKQPVTDAIRAEIEARERLKQALTEERKVTEDVLETESKVIDQIRILRGALENLPAGAVGKAALLRDAIAGLQQELVGLRVPKDLLAREVLELGQQVTLREQLVGKTRDQAEALEIIQKLELARGPLDEKQKEVIFNRARQNALLVEQGEIMERILGPQQQLLLTQQALDALFDQGRISAEQYGVALLQANVQALESSLALEDGFTRAFLKLQLEAMDFASVAEASVNAFADNATQAIVDFAETGKFEFKEFASSLVQDLIRIIARLVIVQALSAFLPGAGGPAAQIGAFLPGRQHGGNVQPNRSYVVGERGPEILRTGSSGGQVIPAPQAAGALGGAPVNVQVVNVDDPNMVPQAIGKGLADEVILNVLARNRDRVKQTIG